MERAWDRFFHEPISPLGIGLDPIFFGWLTLLDLITLWPSRMTWFSEDGVLPMEAAHRYLEKPRLNVLEWLPNDPGWMSFFLVLLAVFAFLQMIGLFTCWSSVGVFVGSVSLHHRNPLILNSGDTYLRVSAFFLIFSQAGAALWLDRWRARRQGRVGPALEAGSPWALRLIELQLSLVYLSTFASEIEGGMWRDGSAVQRPR